MYMKAFLLVLLIGLMIDLIGASRLSTILTSSDGNLEVVCKSDGGYIILVNKNIWLINAATYFQVDGHQYTSADGSLVQTGHTYTQGEDAVGRWKGIRIEYMASSATVWTTIRVYSNVPAVVFGQEFPGGAGGTSVGTRNRTLSAYPNFQTRGANVSLGYLAYADKFVGDMKKAIGRWGGPFMRIQDGVDGGPIVLFDEDTNAIFMTPFNSFMVATPHYDRNASSYGWGIMGEARQLPVDYKVETILYYSHQGIRQAISGWGIAMRRMYNKGLALRDADFTNNYLSYWSDNGAYYVNYYVHNFLIQNRTYQEDMLRYISYAQSLKIPYRTVQYSVWYQTYGGTYGGTTLWKSNPKILPKGMQFMHDVTRLGSTSHNRWWSSKTPYAKQNGGPYEFIIEDRYALPQDKTFWRDIFSISQTWGIRNYMQDWLQLPMELMNATNWDVHVAETWLDQMGSGAQENGITIQYCMSLSRHVLQSLTIPAVTQVRASDDYQPSSDYSYEQWRIGITSMFADAVGLAPFKDTFWTTSDQPGNFYKARDPHVELQSLVASLSTGPVGPGDMVNGTNRTLLMRCCNEDGLILKPSRPAFPVDDQIKQSAFGGKTGPSGEVWTTYSDIQQHRFGIIFGAAMEGSSNIYALGPTESGFGPNFAPSHIYQYREPPSALLNKFSDQEPAILTSGCSRQNFCLFYTSPVFSFRGAELVLLGERDKWIPISPQRVKSISWDMDDFRLTLSGAAGERVNFSAIYNSTYHMFLCTLPLGGHAEISFKTMLCHTL